MNKPRVSQVLMIATILLLAAFEGYWLNKLYLDEYKGLSNGVEVAFRGAIDKLQRRLYEKDTSLTALVVSDTSTPNASAPKILSATRPQATRKAQHKKDTEFSFRFENAEIQQEAHPAQLRSITIKPDREIAGIEVAGVPPPGWMEQMLKRNAAIREAAMQMISRRNVEKAHQDSIYSSQVRKRFPAITIRYNTNRQDSSFQHLYSDTLIKLAEVQGFDYFEKRDNDSGEAHPKRIRIPHIVFAHPGKPPIPVSIKTHPRNVYIEPQADTVLPDPAPRRYPMKASVVKEPPNMIHLVDFFKTNKTLNDSIPVKRIDSAYKAELARVMNGYPPYNIGFKSYKNAPLTKADFEKDSTKEVTTSKVFVGFNTPYSYQAHFSGVQKYILGKMRMQIGGAALLLLLALVSFIIMYRNILAQQKLANIKNDFISNITHELKTPIATVSVAIEALRNFNAIRSPEKTKEYLDISASELQRLGLLVDKVLKLSMFENKKIELRKEQFDMKTLIEETLATMRLQLEKQNARVSFTTEGSSFLIEADKLHITSVIYNLLDNALKYSAGVPVIQIALKAVQENVLELKVSDNGVGIAHQYQQKIFDKFFRVPMGNQHNIKGYGLGLSYVAEIVKQHMGYIYVESILGKGSAFIVKLPVAEADEIRFDEHRVIRKKIL